MLCHVDDLDTAHQPGTRLIDLLLPNEAYSLAVSSDSDRLSRLHPPGVFVVLSRRRYLLAQSAAVLASQARPLSLASEASLLVAFLAVSTVPQLWMASSQPFRSVVTRSTLLQTCCIMRADEAVAACPGKKSNADPGTALQRCWPLNGVLFETDGLAADAEANANA